MCGALINDGSPNVFIGGATVGQANSEIPAWVNWTMMAVGVAAAAVLAGPALAVVGAVGGFAGGEAGSWIGGRVFGEGSDGQKWSLLGGSLLGGMAGAKGATALRASRPTVGLPDALEGAPSIESAPRGSRFDYSVDAVPADLEANTAGVYGYTPKPGTEFSQEKWGVDWTDRDATASARAKRLDYHEGLEEKQAWVEEQRASGVADEDIARQIVQERNESRLSYYPEDEQPTIRARNLAKYQNETGPSYEYFISKGKTAQDMINSATRSNSSMDILTGIATVK